MNSADGILRKCQGYAAARNVSQGAPCRLAPRVTTSLCMFDATPKHEDSAWPKCFPPSTGKYWLRPQQPVVSAFLTQPASTDGLTWSAASSGGSRSTAKMLSPEYTGRSRHCTAPHHRALPWRASPWKRCEEVHFTLAAEFLSDFFFTSVGIVLFFFDGGGGGGSGRQLHTGKRRSTRSASLRRTDLCSIP